MFTKHVKYALISSMRTTIILEPGVNQKIRSHVPPKKISDFINQCVREYFQKEEQKKRQQQLEKAYMRASNATSNQDEYDGVDTEEWPEW